MTDLALLAKIHAAANNASAAALREIEMRRAAGKDPRVFVRDITNTATFGIFAANQSPAQYAETFIQIAALALAAAVAFTEETERTP